MSFQTIPGASGTQFIGTDDRDILLSLNTVGEIDVTANGGNDLIQLVNTTGVIGTATVRGGAGNDTITALTNAGGGVFARFSNSEINAGPGQDEVRSVGAVGTTVRGNEDADNFFLSDNYTSSRLNGNQGADTFTLTGAITLEDTKIQGGSGNDGQMDFTADLDGVAQITEAIDSTINGNAGVDRIQIGQVTAATRFEVRGGQDNDFINTTNTGADGITYAGDLGDDLITNTGSANATLMGGDGNDTIAGGAGDHSVDLGEGNDVYTDGNGTSTVEAGAGNDTLVDAAGDDTYTLSDGNDAYTDGAGADTITGGAGGDTYTDAGGNDDYIIGDGDSAATLTGTTRTFDRFISTDGVTLAPGNEVILTDAAGEALAGNTLEADTITGTIVQRPDDALLIDTATNFANLVDALAGTLTPSNGTGSIATNVVTMDPGGPSDRTYLILNNTNTVLDAGDVMFEVDSAAAANEVIDAINLGYA